MTCTQQLPHGSAGHLMWPGRGVPPPADALLHLRAVVVDPLDGGGVLLLLLLGLELPILVRLVLLLGLLTEGLGRALRCLLKAARRGRRLLLRLLQVKSVGVVQAWRQLCMGHVRSSTGDSGRHTGDRASAQGPHCPRQVEATERSSPQGQGWQSMQGLAAHRSMAFESRSERCSCCYHRCAVWQQPAKLLEEGTPPDLGCATGGAAVAMPMPGMDPRVALADAWFSWGSCLLPSPPAACTQRAHDQTQCMYSSEVWEAGAAAAAAPRHAAPHEVGASPGHSQLSLREQHGHRQAS